MIRRPPRSTHCISSAASDVYKRQDYIKSVKDNNQKSLPVEDVKVISSSVNMKKPGYYTVQFAYGNEEKAEDGGGTYLAVVVEGK